MLIAACCGVAWLWRHQNLEQVFGVSRWRWFLPVKADGVIGDGVYVVEACCWCCCCAVDVVVVVVMVVVMGCSRLLVMS